MKPYITSLNAAELNNRAYNLGNWNNIEQVLGPTLTLHAQIKQATKLKQNSIAYFKKIKQAQNLIFFTYLSMNGQAWIQSYLTQYN